MPARPFALPLVFIGLSFELLGCGELATRKGTTASSQTAPASAVAALSPLAGAIRALAGKWRCRGSVNGPEGAATSEVRLDIRLDHDLDQAWLQTVFAVSSGKYKYKFDSHRTFNTSSSTWVNVIVDNLGGHAVSSSTDGVTWAGESSGPMGATKIRDTENIVSPGKVNLLGQYSTDGRTWNTGYDLSCEK